MEHNHSTRKTITVERISVTTIRTRSRPQKYYCGVCGGEVEVLPISGEKLLLEGQTAAIDVANTAVETDQPK